MLNCTEYNKEISNKIDFSINVDLLHYAKQYIELIKQGL